MLLFIYRCWLDFWKKIQCCIFYKGIWRIVTHLYINIFADVFVFVLQLCVRKWIFYFYFIVYIIFNFNFYYYFLYCWFSPYPSGGDQVFSQVICILPSCISKHLEKIDYQYINNIIVYIIFIGFIPGVLPMP